MFQALTSGSDPTDAAPRRVRFPAASTAQATGTTQAWQGGRGLTQGASPVASRLTEAGLRVRPLNRFKGLTPRGRYGQSRTNLARRVSSRSYVSRHAT